MHSLLYDNRSGGLSVNERKVNVFFSCALLVAGIWGVREQIFIQIVFSLSTLFILAVVRQSIMSVCAISILLILLFPMPNSGWLFGRDSNLAARMTTQIALQGWPIESSLPRTHPETPFIHIHAIITSKVADIGILPSTQGKLLATYLLPISYTAFVSICGYVVSRRIVRSSEKLAIAIFPVVMWIPLYMLKTSFRRQSVGFALFSLFVMVVYLFDYQSKRSAGLMITASVATISAHHVSSLILVLFAGSVSMSGLLTNSRSRAQIPLLIVLLSFLTWQFIAGLGGYLIVGSVSNLTTITRLGIVESIFSSGSQKPFPYSINAPLLIRILDFVSRWIYLGVIGIGSVLLLFVRKKTPEYIADKRTAATVLFGSIIGLISVLSWFAGTLPYKRLFTYFVIVGGPAAVIGFSETGENYLSHRKSYSVAATVVVLLALLAAPMVPMHSISQNDPNYDWGQDDQRFKGSWYSSGLFVANHQQRTTVIADDSVGEVISAKSGNQYIASPDVILEAQVTGNQSVILAQVNEKVYRDFFNRQYGSVIFDPPQVFDRFDANESRIYDSREVRIYK